MNQGIEILMKRMDSNPDEFSQGGKFFQTTQEILYDEDERWFLTKEERKAFKAKLAVLARKKFTAGVMQRLLEEPEEKPDRVRIYNDQKPSITGTRPKKHLRRT